VNVAVILHRRPGEQIAGVTAGHGVISGIQTVRRNRAEIDDVNAILLCQVDEHEADPPQSAVPGLYGCERKAGGHGCINRVAAGSEDLCAGLAGDAVLGRNNAAPNAGDGFADVPVLYEMSAHDVDREGNREREDDYIIV